MADQATLHMKIYTGKHHVEPLDVTVWQHRYQRQTFNISWINWRSAADFEMKSYKGKNIRNVFFFFYATIET